MRNRLWFAWALAFGLLAAAPAHAQEENSLSDDAAAAPRPKRKKRKKKSEPAPEEEAPARPPPPPSHGSDDDLDLQSTKGGSVDSLPEPVAPRPKPKPPPEDEAGSEPKPKRRASEDEAGSEAPRRKPAADDESGSEPKRKSESESTVETRRKSSGDDEAGSEPKPKRRSAVDEEIGEDERKPKRAAEEEGEHGKDEAGYSADWSVVSGTNVGTDQHAIWAELGIPGISAVFLQGRGRKLDMGGGLELDFPPLNGSLGQTPRGLSAARLVGSIHYTPYRSPPLALYLHFDPQWIFAFSGIGMIYLPVTFGAGLDLQVVHLALDVGVAPFSASTRVYFPFHTFGIAPPVVGLAGEYPVTDQLALTLRIRLQTYPWTAQGLFNNGPVSVFFFGNVSAGVAYRF